MKNKESLDLERVALLMWIIFIAAMGIIGVTSLAFVIYKIIGS
jgi:hypothetical protein